MPEAGSVVKRTICAGPLEIVRLQFPFASFVHFRGKENPGREKAQNAQNGDTLEKRQICSLFMVGGRMIERKLKGF
jgi:hypothetical protein